MDQAELDEILKQHKLWLDTGGAKGERANLSNTDLRYVDLRNANLRYAILYNADLGNAILFNTNLSNADLGFANLSNSDLRNADLFNADLEYANLHNIKNKDIITFPAKKHFAYYCGGYIKIGCKCLTIKEWVDSYKEIGQKYRYNDKEVELYGDFIKMINNRYGE